MAGSRRAICGIDEERYLDKISSCDSFTHRREKLQMRDLNQCYTMGYVYAAWCPLFPTAVKIGAFWDPNLDSRKYDRDHHLTFINSGETKVSTTLERLAEEANLPRKFEIIAGIATRNPYSTKWRAHQHFQKFNAPPPWTEFFAIHQNTAVSYFRNLSIELNLPFFPRSISPFHFKDLTIQNTSLPLPTPQTTAAPRPNAWIIPLYCSKPQESPATPQRLCAWDVPLIPKITANVPIAQSESIPGPSSTQEQEKEQLENKLQQPMEVASEESDCCDEDIASNSVISDGTTATAGSDSTTKRKKRTRPKKKYNDYCQIEATTQGLFVAEMSNGMHISMGQCWATKHYNSLDPDSPPVYVVHMPLPTRLP